jgi:hypothetical protein
MNGLSEDLFTFYKYSHIPVNIIKNGFGHDVQSTPTIADHSGPDNLSVINEIRYKRTPLHETL